MNYYHFEQEGPQVFKTKNRPSGAVDSGVEPSTSKSQLKGRQLAHRDQTSPEHIGLETVFNNDTEKEQTYNFKFDKTRRATVSVNYQRGYSIGGNANFSLGLPKVMADSSLGAGMNMSLQRGYYIGGNANFSLGLVPKVMADSSLGAGMNMSLQGLGGVNLLYGLAGGCVRLRCVDLLSCCAVVDVRGDDPLAVSAALRSERGNGCEAGPAGRQRSARRSVPAGLTMRELVMAIAAMFRAVGCDLVAGAVVVSSPVVVTKSTGETFEESIVTSANSQITVDKHSHYVASVVMEERSLLAEFELDMIMSLPAKRAPVYIRSKSSGELVFVYSVNNLPDLFEECPDVRKVKDADGMVKADAVQFHIEGLVDGMQLSSHVINLSGRSLEGGPGEASAAAELKEGGRDGGERSP
ncbi:hypothetical protein ACOMHN_039568 [Nucella lapillus]